MIPTPHLKGLAICEWVTVAYQLPVPAVMVGAETWFVLWNFRLPTVAVYCELSAKYASSAVTRLRRSDFVHLDNRFPLDPLRASLMRLIPPVTGSDGPCQNEKLSLTAKFRVSPTAGVLKGL